MEIFKLLVTAATGLRHLIVSRLLQARISGMWHEHRILSAKRKEETLAFANGMIASIEANQLGPDAIELLAEILSRPDRQVDGKKEVIDTLRCLLNDPDYLQPPFRF